MKLTSNKIFALDLGTTKFCIGSLVKNNKQHHDLHIISIPAKGTQKGMICEFNAAKDTLSSLLTLAENKINKDIDACIVGISGQHIFNETYTIKLNINGAIVNQRIIEQLEHKCYEKAKKENYEILHLIPTYYIIDDRPPTANPIGFSGNNIHVNFFVVYADKCYLQDVVRLCNEVGLRVVNIYSECVASSTVCIDDTKKQIGVVMADIGGGTTDCIVFQNSMPHFIFTLNIGGNIFTYDLAVGLNLAFSEAEKVKVFFGSENQNKDKRINVKSINGKEIEITYNQVLDILLPRIKELAFLLSKNLLTYKGKLGGGIVLTGGSSQISGIEDILSSYLKVPVQKAYPYFNIQTTTSQTINLQNNKIIYSPKYATVLGLLNLELSKMINFHSYPTYSKISTNYVQTFINWIKELAT